MTMITAQQAAEKWGTSLRNVQDLCKRGRIIGAERWGAAWMIPSDAPKPVDGRCRTAKSNSCNQPLLRKSMFLNMTDLYQITTQSDAAVAALEPYPEAQLLLSTEIDHCRGRIEQVYLHADRILNNHSGLYAVLAGGMLLGECAVFSGDLSMYQRAKRHLYQAPWQTAQDLDLILLSIASTDQLVRTTKDFPEWFTRGCFEAVHPDALPSVFVLYCKYLLTTALEQTTGTVSRNGPTGMSLLRTLPYIVEPLISQVSASGIHLAQIHLRLICAISYMQSGFQNRAAAHVDKAIALAMPDQLYMPFVSYRKYLGTFLDERLMAADEGAAKMIKELHKQYTAGWTKLHNSVLQQSVQFALSAREREVARLAALGMSDEQISCQLNLPIQTVSGIISQVIPKTGITSRSDLGLCI